MKKEVQRMINEECEHEFERACNEINYNSPVERLRSCSATVIETEHYYILRSYNTLIACINKANDTCYDLLRTVYGYTATSAQHVAKFDAGAPGAYETKTGAIEDYLGFTPTEKQVEDIDAALKNAIDCDDLMVDLLTICEKRRWIHKTICGYCQRDWNDIFYPAELYDDDFIDFVSSIYFGTGSEYMIYECDENDDKTDPLDCDGYCDYFSDTIARNDDLLKERIAEDERIKPEDVTIYHIHTKHTTIDSWEVA